MFGCAGQSILPYPSWGRGRPSYCGHPAFELNCTVNPPVITISEISYRILDIDVNRRAFTLARDDYWTNNCPEVKRSSTSESNLSDFFDYSPYSSNLTLFYRCPLPLTLASIPVYFNCTGDVGLTNFFGTEKMVTGDLRNLIPDCETTVNVRISNSQVNTLQWAFATPTEQLDLNVVINEGFRLFWKVNNSRCDECEESGGQCGSSNSSSAEFSCYCKDGFFLDRCGSLSETSLSPSPGTNLSEGFEVNWNVNNSRCDECKESGGQCRPSNSSSVEFSCYCKDGIFLARCGSLSETSHSESPGSSSKRVRIIVIMVGVSAVIVILFIMFIYYFRRKFRKVIMYWRRDTGDEFNVEEFIRNYGSFAPKQYSYADLKKMTKSFAEKIGVGGFGTVYKGKLPNGFLVAVKMLNKCKGDGQEFVYEVASIGWISHVNIVTLLGFCCEKKKRALVYEYMANGSLDKLIFNRDAYNTEHCSEWQTHCDIALGIARGLEYLHRGCNTTILHLDIKPQNIVFWTITCTRRFLILASPRLKKDKTLSMVGARGTIGYIAPEVFSRAYGRVSQKSDVYSFGMLVLKMVCVDQYDMN